MGGSRISLLVAVARNGVIGARGGMPWHLPGDLRYFRNLTMGHPIVMGRKTWDSIGRALPGRTSVVITRQPDFRAPGAVVVDCFGAALRECAGSDEVFVIGGGEIFRQALPIAERLYLTEIHRDYEGDVFFPAVDASLWREVSRRAESDGELAYDYVVYDRIQ